MKMIIALGVIALGFHWLITINAYLGMLVMFVGYIGVMISLMGVGIKKDPAIKQEEEQARREFVTRVRLNRERETERRLKAEAKERYKRRHNSRAVAGGVASIGAVAAASSMYSDDDTSFFTDDDSTFDSLSDTVDINPATGLPMVGGAGGVDAMGNTYGFDNSDTFNSDSFGTDSSSSMDDSFSSMDDSFSSVSDW